jgi:hypothetical protein
MPFRSTVTLKFRSKPSGASVSFRYVSSCASWMGASSSTAFNSTHHQLFNEKIQLQSTVERLPLVHDVDGRVCFKCKLALRKFMTQAPLVDALE